MQGRFKSWPQMNRVLLSYEVFCSPRTILGSLDKGLGRRFIWLGLQGKGNDFRKSTGCSAGARV
jgi:hypothetical protein